MGGKLSCCSIGSVQSPSSQASEDAQLSSGGRSQNNVSRSSEKSSESSQEMSTTPQPLLPTRISSSENASRNFVQKQQKVSPSVPHRSEPILANSVNLCEETRLVLEGSDLTQEIGTVIATSYSRRKKFDKAANVAANLVLDLNLKFEEELQVAIEKEPHFREQLLKAVIRIHQNLDIQWVTIFNENEPKGKNPGQNHRENNLEYLFNMLLPYYEKEPLRELVLGNDGRESTFKKFKENKKNKKSQVNNHDPSEAKSKDADQKLSAEVNNGKPSETKSKEDKERFSLFEDFPQEYYCEENAIMAEGYLKQLKMLLSQIPYFGGSVEYKVEPEKGDKFSIEYLIYHLSTITRDPQRFTSIDNDVNGVRLPKPMKDYETPPNSLLPKWNQQNLGLGVAEAEWEQLTVGMRQALSAGVIKFFNKCVSGDKDESDHGKETEHELIQSEEYTAKFNEMLNFEEKALSRFSDEDVRKIWDRQDEDGRKFLYGDIAQIPWSDAHLHGGDLFEDNYDPEKHAAELGYRHPSIVEKKQGLHNVAGVHGNILLTPSVACDRYIKKLRSIFEIPEHEENFTFKFRGLPDKYNSKDVAEEFTAKHQDWYKNAYDNHQPIIGGMSGHTLAYLNLYRAAVNKIQDESFDGPSLETIRTIMLAALVGNKRHHSYNEVMSASVGLKFDRDEKSELTYKDRVGYRDILKSPEFIERELDKKVVKKAGDAYIELKDNTVLSTIRKHLGKQEDEERLKTLVRQYFQDLASDDSEKIEENKENITNFLQGSLNVGGAKDESSDGHI